MKNPAALHSAAREFNSRDGKEAKVLALSSGPSIFCQASARGMKKVRNKEVFLIKKLDCSDINFLHEKWWESQWKRANRGVHFVGSARSRGFNCSLIIIRAWAHSEALCTSACHHRKAFNETLPQRNYTIGVRPTLCWWNQTRKNIRLHNTKYPFFVHKSMRYRTFHWLMLITMAILHFLNYFHLCGNGVGIIVST